MQTRVVLPAVLTLLMMTDADVAAGGLDQVRQRGRLLWGGDQEGGGPYIYPRADDPNMVTGFEVELMELVAQRLGVHSRFEQCQWTSLPDLLRTGGIDLIVNGYELTEPHLATKIATIPYYIYELQLIARRDDPSIRSWDDLKQATKRRKKVGVLLGSAAETYVRERLGQSVEVIGYEGSTDAMLEVQTGKLDATVQDLPPAIFYGERYPALQFVGPPVGRGYYVMYLRPGDEDLRDEIDRALLDVIQNGELRGLYERYGLWNATQERLGTPSLDLPTRGKSVQLGGWKVVAHNLPILLQAAWVTVALSFLAMPLAMATGLSVALGRLYGPQPLRWLLTAYVEVLRGTPVLLQLFTIFYILPSIGIRIPAFPAAVIGLAINYSAYEAEIYRAGLLAIPVGQLEAALSLGMSRFVALRQIIVPQAVRLVIPPVTNDFIALFKDTSVCSFITVVELTKRYSIAANSTGAYLELAAVTAILYLAMSYPLSLFARRLETKTKHVAV